MLLTGTRILPGRAPTPSGVSSPSSSRLNWSISTRDAPQPHGDLHATEMEVQRNLKFTLAGAGVAENEHREAIHRETPNHAKGVKVREKGHVTMADDDGDDLQRHDDIDDAIACAEALVWLPEPFAEHTVFRYPVEDAV